MSKLSKIAAVVAVTPILATASASAVTLGQVGAGDIYRVRNVSVNANGEFADTAKATCGETVQFRVRIHNSGPDALTNVKVKATLDGNTSTNHGSTVSVSADNAMNNAVVSDTAGVMTDKATSISYVAGSTELLGYSATPGQSPVIGQLPDGITGNGVNIGTVNALTSDTRSVQFKAKLNCNDTPTPGKIKVCELKTKKIVVIDEKSFDSSKYTKDLNKCEDTPGTPNTPSNPETPTELVKTGAGEVAAIFAAAAAFGAVVYNVVLRRQNAR